MFRSLKFKLSFPIFIAILILAVSVSVIILKNFKRFYLESLVEEESRTLLLTARTMPDSLLVLKNRPTIQDYCLFLDRYLKERVTFIDTDGVVLGDSRLDSLSVAALENHKNRPEIRGLWSLGREFDFETRFSETLRQSMLYAACPVVRDGRLLGYLRVATPLKEIDSYLISQALAVMALTVTAFILIGFLVYRYSRRIQDVISEIGERARFLENAGGGEKRHIGFSTETDRLYGFLDDTAGRLQALIRDLVAQREEFRALLRSVPEGVVAVDSRMNVMFANDNACRLFDSRYASDTLPVMPLTGFTHMQTFQDMAAEGLSTGKRVEGTVVVKGLAREYDLKTVCTPLAGEGRFGRGLALLTLVDLTEEKRLARAKAEFVEAASHELRTPLTVLKGYVDTLKEAPDEAMRRKSFEKISQSVARLENLTGDLLELSYLESGKVPLKYGPVDLGRLAGEILGDLETQIRDKGISVSSECSVALESVPELVYIALYNLLTNAVKYNRPNGRIEVRAALKDGSCEISVLDSGLGIPREFREKVFERFFRIDKHRSRETGGTGLGLAIVKHIASVLKGSVRAVDGLDNGAGFILTLPAA